MSPDNYVRIWTDNTDEEVARRVESPDHTTGNPDAEDEQWEFDGPRGAPPSDPNAPEFVLGLIVEA